VGASKVGVEKYHAWGGHLAILEVQRGCFLLWNPLQYPRDAWVFSWFWGFSWENSDIFLKPAYIFVVVVCFTHWRQRYIFHGVLVCFVDKKNIVLIYFRLKSDDLITHSVKYWVGSQTWVPRDTHSGKWDFSTISRGSGHSHVGVPTSGSTSN